MKQIEEMDTSERKASTLWGSFRKKTFLFRSRRREDGSPVKIVRTIWSLYYLYYNFSSEI